MRKLLTTLLPSPNYLKQSNLYKNNLLPILLPLTTSYYLLSIRVFYVQCLCKLLYLCISFFQCINLLYSVT